MFIKRLVAAAAISTLSIVGIAPAATAASKSSDVKIVKTTPKHVKPGSAIDWDSPQRMIDWD